MRLVKSPKIYIRDSGLLHALLGADDMRAIERHPKLGASFEGFVLEEIVRRYGERNVFFWATHAGAELDVLVTSRGRRLGFEIKWADAPKMTKSMHQAIADLDLSRLFVVYPGPARYRLHAKVDVVPVTQLESIR